MTIDEESVKEMAVFHNEISKANDSVYGVLITHLYIESLIDRCILANTQKDAGLIGKQGLSFNNKVFYIYSFYRMVILFRKELFI